MKRQGIRGIIFDLDGVLIDSTDCHRDAFQTVFAGHGIQDFDYTPYAGWRTPDVVVDVFRRAGSLPVLKKWPKPLARKAGWREN